MFILGPSIFPFSIKWGPKDKNLLFSFKDLTFDLINLLLAGTLDEIEDRKPGQAVRRLIHRSSDRREDIWWRAVWSKVWLVNAWAWARITMKGPNDGADNFWCSVKIRSRFWSFISVFGPAVNQSFHFPFNFLLINTSGANNILLLLGIWPQMSVYYNEN